MRFNQIISVTLVLSSTVQAGFKDLVDKLGDDLQDSAVTSAEHGKFDQLKKLLDVEDDLTFLKDPPDEMSEDIIDLVNARGFKIERHEVTTQDGYVLGLYRIPGTLNGEKDYSNNAPILFMHGLADSSDSWVVNSADRAPALIASSNGYDVWLGNFRGNKHSHENSKIDPVR